MKIGNGLLKNFIRLSDGESVPASALKSFRDLQRLCDDGILSTIVHGSRRSYKCANRGMFLDFLASEYNIHNLEAIQEMLTSNEANRAKQVELTGDSKFVKQRVMKGFLVNSYEPIDATLNDTPFIINPPDGTYVFVYDYEAFTIPSDVLIIGIENSENFRRISQQKWLFDEMYPNRQILFVSRYPQNESRDLVRWLQSIGNEYVHFGDLDLAGISIFITEFYRYLGERSSFLIPPDYEERIKNGSRERYDVQLTTTKNMIINDPRLRALAACIHKYHRGYDQEGYIRTRQQF